MKRILSLAILLGLVSTSGAGQLTSRNVRIYDDGVLVSASAFSYTPSSTDYGVSELEVFGNTPHFSLHVDAYSSKYGMGTSEMLTVTPTTAGNHNLIVQVSDVFSTNGQKADAETMYHGGSGYSAVGDELFGQSLGWTTTTLNFHKSWLESWTLTNELEVDTSMGQISVSSGASVVISSVPEPTAVVLAGIGIAGMVGYRFVKRRQ